MRDMMHALKRNANLNLKILCILEIHIHMLYACTHVHKVSLLQYIPNGNMFVNINGNACILMTSIDIKQEGGIAFSATIGI